MTKTVREAGEEALAFYLDLWQELRSMPHQQYLHVVMQPASELTEQERRDRIIRFKVYT